MILIGRGLDLRSGFLKDESLNLRYEFLHCLVLRVHLKSGGNSEEVPPVPIPNTEVKLLSVYDTWRVTARENGTLPEQMEIGETICFAYQSIWIKYAKLHKLNIFLIRSTTRAAHSHA